MGTGDDQVALALVTEDWEARALDGLLVACGLETLVANDANTALHALVHKPALVFIAQSLVGGEGLSFLRILRGYTGANAFLPVALFGSGPEDLNAFLQDELQTLDLHHAIPPGASPEAMRWLLDELGVTASSGDRPRPASSGSIPAIPAALFPLASNPDLPAIPRASAPRAPDPVFPAIPRASAPRAPDPVFPAIPRASAPRAPVAPSPRTPPPPSRRSRRRPPAAADPTSPPRSASKPTTTQATSSPDAPLLRIRLDDGIQSLELLDAARTRLTVRSARDLPEGRSLHLQYETPATNDSDDPVSIKLLCRLKGTHPDPRGQAFAVEIVAAQPEAVWHDVVRQLQGLG